MLRWKLVNVAIFVAHCTIAVRNLVAWAWVSHKSHQ
jgi:hypothetical protein